MPESVDFEDVGIGDSRGPRHSAIVRVTHWFTVASFFGLLVSGGAILVAHPRLYWGETGALGTPSLVDLPIPFLLGHSGWGRHLHFLSAWVCALTGLLYVLHGLATQHFRNLLPSKDDFTWERIRYTAWHQLNFRRPANEEPLKYNVLQQLTYLAVVFVLFRLIILSGFAMSPAITSVVPALTDVIGGQQSARTIHFFIATFAVFFVFVHVAMVYRAGFTKRVRAMITDWHY